MTEPTVLLINPNTSQETTQAMHRLACQSLPQGWVLRNITAEQGARMITTEDELRVAVDQVVHMGQQLAPEVDAIVVGAFGNPGLAALRQAVSIPVNGIGEASMREAALGGQRFRVHHHVQVLGDVDRQTLFVFQLRLADFLVHQRIVNVLAQFAELA